MSTGEFKSIHYSQYLALDKILDAQHLRSEMVDNKAAHEEMLFIIVHQVYELWFKQIIHEVGSVMDMFRNDDVDERNLGVAIGRLERVTQIQDLLITQIGVMESMTPLDFLEFRKHLFPASGFQSYQFRKVEVLLGLPREKRLSYNGKPYTQAFGCPHANNLIEMEAGDTLFTLVEDWLERTPFLNFKNFNFLESYKAAVYKMLESQKKAIMETDQIDEEEKQMRLVMLGSMDTYYDVIFDENKHNELVKSNKVRLSYKAMLAALFIELYRDEPLLQLPHQLLQKLIDIDEMFTTWRYRHAQMVMRMLGRKVGTGGSSGYEYLKSTAEKHHVFKDLHNIATLMIPRTSLPKLPEEIQKQLGFYFTDKF